MQAIEACKAGKKKHHKGDEERDLLGDEEFVELNKISEFALDEPSAGYFKKVIPQIQYQLRERKEKRN